MYLFTLLSLYYLAASFAFVYLIIFLTLLFRFFFVVPSLFVYFCRFQFLFVKRFSFFWVFSYLCLCINWSLYFYFALFSFLYCKYQNANIIYIYLNAYLCFYLSVSFTFSLLFQWIFFSCLSKVVLLLSSRWNRCFSYVYLFVDFIW